MIRGKVSIFLMAVFLIVPLVTSCGLYGRSSGQSKKVVVVGNENQKPVAIATSDVTGGTVSLTVQFDGSGSYDPDNDILIYLWDFGDGSAISTEVSPVHEYLTATVFIATLTVYDTGQGSDNQKITITVLEPAVNESPVAVATSDITGGPAPLTVQFDGSGSYDPESGQLTYLWAFGDGSASSSEVSPVHEYSNHGIYAARLTVQDPDGASDSQTVTITVTEPGAESVAIDIKPGNWPNTINLTEEGVVTVAILTTPDFDAASVDTSIGENGEGKVYLSAALPKISGNSGKYSMFKDVDGDGDLDLVIQFYVELMDPDTFEIEGETTYAILTGQTWAGEAFWGRDQIGIVKE